MSGSSNYQLNGASRFSFLTKFSKESLEQRIAEDSSAASTDENVSEGAVDYRKSVLSNSIQSSEENFYTNIGSTDKKHKTGKVEIALGLGNGKESEKNNCENIFAELNKLSKGGNHAVESLRNKQTYHKESNGREDITNARRYEYGEHSSNVELGRSSADNSGSSVNDDINRNNNNNLEDRNSNIGEDEVRKCRIKITDEITLVSKLEGFNFTTSSNITFYKCHACSDGNRQLFGSLPQLVNHMVVHYQLDDLQEEYSRNRRELEKYQAGLSNPRSDGSKPHSITSDYGTEGNENGSPVPLLSQHHSDKIKPISPNLSVVTSPSSTTSSSAPVTDTSPSSPPQLSSLSSSSTVSSSSSLSQHFKPNSSFSSKYSYYQNNGFSHSGDCSEAQSRCSSSRSDSPIPPRILSPVSNASSSPRYPNLSCQDSRCEGNPEEEGSRSIGHYSASVLNGKTSPSMVDVMEETNESNPPPVYTSTPVVKTWHDGGAEYKRKLNEYASNDIDNYSEKSLNGNENKSTSHYRDALTSEPNKHSKADDTQNESVNSFSSVKKLRPDTMLSDRKDLKSQDKESASKTEDFKGRDVSQDDTVNPPTKLTPPPSLHASPQNPFERLHKGQFSLPFSPFILPPGVAQGFLGSSLSPVFSPTQGLLTNPLSYYAHLSNSLFAINQSLMPQLSHLQMVKPQDKSSAVYDAQPRSSSHPDVRQADAAPQIWNQSSAGAAGPYKTSEEAAAAAAAAAKCSSLSKTHSRLDVVRHPIKRDLSCKSMLMSDGRTVYRCEYCKKDFCTMSDVNRHMDFHEDIRPYKCRYCSYYARTNSQLKVHMMRHQGIREFMCHLCSYKGVTQSDLNRHTKSQIHRMKAKNECRVCHEGFVSSVNLEQHYREKHSLTGVHNGVIAA